MARGPLPSKNARRRNAPTIPTATLPAEGRTDPAPECPYELREAGQKWWEWAWKLPQATRWDDGALYFVARRAQLEDEMAATKRADDFDSGYWLSEFKGDSQDAKRALMDLIRTLKSAATGSTALMKEMREIDNRLGLNPSALAALRWEIEETAPEQRAPAGSNVRHIRAVDAQAG